MAAPRYPDINTLIATRMLEFDKKAKEGFAEWTESLFLSTRNQLRIMDEQDHCRKFKWYNLPKGIDANLLERILYYRYQGAFFYVEELDRFYFLPYALDGEIDEYGRYKRIKPLPFFGSSDAKATTPKGAEKTAWLNSIQKNVIYDMMLPEEIELEHYLDGAVLLCDYSKQISQTGLPRCQLSESIINVMAEIIPFMRTALINSTGIEGMRIDQTDDESNVFAASESVQRAAILGRKWIPIIGSVEFQQLTTGPVAKAEEFLLTLQALDNYRLSTHGLANGGLFLKKAHMLEGEQKMQNTATSPVMLDGLEQRLDFCDLINATWGHNTYVEIAEDPSALQQQAIPETDPNNEQESEGENNVE